MGYSSFAEALRKIIEFRDERDWKQFHTPKDLTVALSLEVAEVLQLFLWKSTEDIHRLLDDEAFRTRLEEELGDVLIYALILCHETDVEPGEAIAKKLRKNQERYPVHLAKGSAKKYDEFGQ